MANVTGLVTMPDAFSFMTMTIPNFGVAFDQEG